MTARSREIEFKFAVQGAQAFRQLVRQLDLPESSLDHGVSQTNHFFDSPALCLHRHHFVIRLREQGEDHILTIKGEQRSNSDGSTVLTDRIEQEVHLPEGTALALLQGSLGPRQVVERHFEERSAAMLQLIQSACGEEELVHIGEFGNVRIHLPRITLFAGGSPHPVAFELDTSTFPDGSIDHELEIEITEDSDAVAIETALIALLRDAGIEWHSAPSKARRFFGALAE